VRWFVVCQRTFFMLLVHICPRVRYVSFQSLSMKLIVSIHGTQGFSTWNAGFHPMKRIVSSSETHSLKPMKHRVSSM